MTKHSLKGAILGLAGAALLAGAAGASAREPDILVLSHGENFAVAYGTGHHGNLVGGGMVRAMGSGENGSIEYSGAVAHQPLMVPRLVGGGEEQQIAYAAPQVSDSLLAASGLQEIALAR